MTKIKIGIDPGPTYTAVSVIEDEVLILSTTYKRPAGDVPPVFWATEVAHMIQKEIIERWPDADIGIEGVVTPQSHFQGKKNLINPKTVIHTALVVGALAALNPTAVIVRPGKNGSQATYPEELTGTRPKTLEGKAVGTRNHERSAFDVANQVPLLKKENYILDNQKSVI